MDERIFGLETEYAISFLQPAGLREPSKGHLVSVLIKLVVRNLGLPGCSFLLNGSKFHYDVDHAEWALAECRSAREAAAFDKAADHVLAKLLSEANEVLTREGYLGELCVYKNNVDTAGHSYGCHENYATARASTFLNSTEQLRLTIQFLVPFLTSRQILVGAGRLGWGHHATESLRYQISQRADYMNTVAGPDTRQRRAIVNIGREHEPLSSGNALRRLHLILGDANLSGWATFMKLGTTGIVLRLLEDMACDDVPVLHDPVDALQRISRDPACRAQVLLSDGRSLTAVEIQRIYLDMAERYFRHHPASEEEAMILSEWRMALTLLAQDPSALQGKVDWVTKKLFLDKFLEREPVCQGWTWERLAAAGDAVPPTVANKLLRQDIEYHHIHPDKGWHHKIVKRLCGGASDPLITQAEIDQALAAPPPYTRARIRGDAIASARRANIPVKVEAWDLMEIGGERILLPDPFSFFMPRLYELLRNGVPQRT